MYSARWNNSSAAPRSTGVTTCGNTPITTIRIPSTTTGASAAAGASGPGRGRLLLRKKSV